MESLLSGIRILDLSRVLAGPYGTLLMGDLGAEIIKIEDPEGGDPTRHLTPQKVEGEDPYFLGLNRNKKSITLKLTTSQGREIFHRLVKVSDVVYDNFRPDVLEKVGADYETLQNVNPRIISCSISGFGHTGPRQFRPAFDLTLQAMGGAMSVTGEPGRPPVRLGLPMGDLAGGMFAAYAISAALFFREKTGKGLKIDLSLLDCQVSLLTYMAQYYLFNGVIPGPIGSGHQSIVPYQAFQTQDRWVVVAVFVEKFWPKFCKVLGLESLASDPRFDKNQKRLQNKATLIPLLEEAVRKWKGEDLLQKLDEEDVPAAPVNTLDRILADPQILSRNMVVEMAHPKAGRFKTVGNPVKVSLFPEEKFEPPPLLSQHNEAVYRGMLGFSSTDLRSWKKEGII
ncbi:MAG: CoA transferase [Thermodesulfobacteriota bacterium]|nr:CoA transferase [Thermodesulfobacteriota bacterium]